MIDCIIKYLNLHSPQRLPTYPVFLRSHRMFLETSLCRLIWEEEKQDNVISTGQQDNELWKED